jgi:hypothetical protein
MNGASGIWSKIRAKPDGHLFDSVSISQRETCTPTRACQMHRFLPRFLCSRLSFLWFALQLTGSPRVTEIILKLLNEVWQYKEEPKKLQGRVSLVINVLRAQKRREDYRCITIVTYSTYCNRRYFSFLLFCEMETHCTTKAPMVPIVLSTSEVMKLCGPPPRGALWSSGGARVVFMRDIYF